MDITPKHHCPASSPICSQMGNIIWHYSEFYWEILWRHFQIFHDTAVYVAVAVLSNQASILTLIPFLTQSPCKLTLTDRGRWVYPSNRAAGCTLTVGAAGCTLTLGAAGCTLTARAAGRGLVRVGGVIGLCPCGSCYVLLGLCPRGLRYTLTVQASPSQQ